MTNEAPAIDRDAILLRWQEAEKMRVAWTAVEKDLRAQVIATRSEHYDPQDMHTGVETVSVGNGWKLKVTHKLNYTLDSADDYAKTEKQLTLMEGEIGEELTDRLVKRKIELSVGEYNKLSGKAKQLIDRVLTIKPAAKSVELVPPPTAGV